MRKLYRFPVIIPLLVFVLSWSHLTEAAAAASADSKGDREGGLFRDNIKEAVRASFAQLSGYGTFTGKQGFLDRVLVGREDIKTMLKPLMQAVHPEDIVLLALLGWFTVPVLRFPYERWPKQDQPFRKTPAYIFADIVQQAAKIGVLVYVVDILQLACITFGFEFCKLGDIPHAFAQSAYTAFIARQIARAKKYWIRRYISEHPDTFGRMQIVNRLGNAAIIVATGVIILNILKLKMGVAANSFLAMGSVTTLAMGLASKDIATQIMNGLLLASSDNIYEGDQVKFGNGLEGTIVSLGWVETVLRGNDSILVSVPNTNLVKQQISNLSRIRYSEVSQTLTFKYADMPEIPALLASIKEEIVMACPKVINDGSRPFRAVWTNIGKGGSIQVEIQAHFQIRPIGEEYHLNRMEMLHAIRRAIETLELTPV